MRAILAALTLAASLAEATAAVVEAGTLTTVTVTAPLYDTTTTSVDGGCSPEGCVGDNTRVSNASVIISSKIERLCELHLSISCGNITHVSGLLSC